MAGGGRGWRGGVAVTAVSYAGVASATTPVELVAAIVAFQIAVNMLLAPMMAIMAEEVPDAQKGIAGGLIALGSPLASAFSAVLVGAGDRGGGGAARHPGGDGGGLHAAAAVRAGADPAGRARRGRRARRAAT
ncbi:MAG: hypothetical protein PGN08_10120 [Sphingomonas taxi]